MQTGTLTASTIGTCKACCGPALCGPSGSPGDISGYTVRVHQLMHKLWLGLLTNVTARIWQPQPDPGQAACMLYMRAPRMRLLNRRAGVNIVINIVSLPVHARPAVGLSP